MDKLVVRLNAEPPREIVNAKAIQLILWILNNMEWFEKNNWSGYFSFGVDAYPELKLTETQTTRPRKGT